MSTEFLTQTLVWRNWPLDEILLGRLDLAREHVIVALSIILAMRGCAPSAAAARAVTSARDPVAMRGTLDPMPSKQPAAVAQRPRLR